MEPGEEKRTAADLETGVTGSGEMECNQTADGNGTSRDDASFISTFISLLLLSASVVVGGLVLLMLAFSGAGGGPSAAPLDGIGAVFGFWGAVGSIVVFIFVIKICNFSKQKPRDVFLSFVLLAVIAAILLKTYFGVTL